MCVSHVTHTMNEVMIKTRRKVPVMYLHYDPPTKEYMVQHVKIGACVFTAENAASCISELPGGRDMWTTEDCPESIHISHNHPAVKKVLDELKKLPGYKV